MIWERMYEEFCKDSSLDERIRQAMENAPKDAVLLSRAKEAVGRRDQETFREVCKEGVERYGAIFTLLALGECFPLTKRYYPDEAIRKATLSDIAIWEYRCESKTGSVGVDNYAWFRHHACGFISRLGRLQYEEALFPFDVTIIRDAEGAYGLGPKEGSVVVAKGLPCLRLHVPEGSPLYEKEVDASLLSASLRFPRYPVAVCDSWLLDPALSLVLPPSSRIIHFMKRFVIFPILEQGEPQIYERVFGFGLDELDVLSFHAQNALQEHVQEALRMGVRFHTTGGFLVLGK